MRKDAIRLQIEKYKEQGLKLFVSSSFQTHSIPLLHILSEIDNQIPVMFINTGYLFPETLRFRDEVARLLGLNVINVSSNISKVLQKDADGKLLYASDPDYCCFLNKTQPMETVLAEYDIWINGIRADQSAVRKQMQTEQEAGFGCKRFHPMLDWTSKMIYDYRKEYNLPAHPLEEKGYLSIGCEPCTQKPVGGDERSGRWAGLNKTECGLHLDLIKK